MSARNASQPPGPLARSSAPERSAGGKLARRRIPPAKGTPGSNLDLLAFALDTLCPVDDSPCFETLIDAIDDAEERRHPERRKILRLPFNSLG